MTKTEMANRLGVPIGKISRWTHDFADWFDFGAELEDKMHDEDDFQVFTLISKLDAQIEEDVDPKERIRLIEAGLQLSDPAVSIRLKRKEERARPEVARWQVVSSSEAALLRQDFEWLKPLRSCISSIADFGCSASEAKTCSQSYALLWTLEATRVVVVDKDPEHICYAQKWLETYRTKHPYFKKYNLEFVVGDMTGRIDGLNEGEFELSYCQNVLYIVHKEKDLKGTQNAIDEMIRVVKPGGWVIAIEPKIGAGFEDVPIDCFGGKLSLPCQKSDPIDISWLFEAAGLVRVSIDGASKWAYCYRKPFD